MFREFSNDWSSRAPKMVAEEVAVRMYDHTGEISGFRCANRLDFNQDFPDDSS